MLWVNAHEGSARTLSSQISSTLAACTFAVVAELEQSLSQCLFSPKRSYPSYTRPPSTPLDSSSSHLGQLLHARIALQHLKTSHRISAPIITKNSQSQPQNASAPTLSASTLFASAAASRCFCRALCVSLLETRRTCQFHVNQTQELHAQKHNRTKKCLRPPQQDQDARSTTKQDTRSKRTASHRRISDQASIWHSWDLARRSWEQHSRTSVRSSVARRVRRQLAACT